MIVKMYTLQFEPPTDFLISSTSETITVSIYNDLFPEYKYRREKISDLPLDEVIYLLTQLILAVKVSTTSTIFDEHMKSLTKYLSLFNQIGNDNISKLLFIDFVQCVHSFVKSWMINLKFCDLQDEHFAITSTGGLLCIFERLYLYALNNHFLR